MKPTTALSLALAATALVLLRPAAACPNLAELDRASTSAASVAAPAYPIAGFEQMLAARTPEARAVEPPARADARADVLLPYFQAMLWSAPASAGGEASARIEHTARIASTEVRP